MTLHQFIRDLEQALVPLDGDYLVVDHPDSIRSWLGEDAVVAPGDVVEVDGCDPEPWPAMFFRRLSDPEAAQWALAAARCLDRRDFDGAQKLLHAAPEGTESEYVIAVMVHGVGGEA